MALFALKELLKAGVHYGHRTSKWNPKMDPYLFGKRNSIHIIDLAGTVKGLYTAYKYLLQVSQEGGETVFVGTKRPAQRAVRKEAVRCGMHFVKTRWIGGTLTNFDVVRSRLKRLDELEVIEQAGSESNYSKKMMSALMREKRKIARNLGGIRFMEKMPKAMVIVDPMHEEIALREAKRKGIAVIALTDTNCDPDVVDIVIPGNDDAMKSISLIVGKLADAVLEGRNGKVGPTAVLAEPELPTEEAEAEVGGEAEPETEPKDNEKETDEDGDKEKE